MFMANLLSAFFGDLKYPDLDFEGGLTLALLSLS